MRSPLIRIGGIENDELVIDNFAGGGGASSGIEAALGRPVDFAINHDPEALAVHKANHPETRHFLEDVWKVDPREACAGRRVGLAWFSPDCTHFSRAKGSKPRDQGIRGLAWVVIRWAKAVAPRMIILENVEEFQTWGPLDADGYPIKERSGETFLTWVGELTALGYSVQLRSLVAADYGTPTTRRRLFVVARRDGAPAWPDPSHGDGLDPWRPASEVIDWSLPCPSIFERKRPLAEATQKRIAAGIRRYVVEASDPFIVPLTHQGGVRVHNIREPMRTITGAHRGELALVEPFIVRHGHYSKKTGAGTFRGQPLRLPLATVCATNDKHLVCPVILKHYGGVVGHRVDRVLGTVTGTDHHALAAAFLTKFYGTSTGAPVQLPLPTITANTRGGGHLAEVRAFLLKYYGNGSASRDARSPLHTVTSKARFGLVTVRGEEYQIVDIGMRMLQPHELFAAQGFRQDYEIRPEHNGKPLTKTTQIRLAGNSVCPPVAEAVVRANLGAA